MRDHPRIAAAIEIASQAGLAYGSNQLLMLTLSTFSARNDLIERFYRGRYALDATILAALWLLGGLPTGA